jgi:hypothetical protein
LQKIIICWCWKNWCVHCNGITFFKIYTFFNEWIEDCGKSPLSVTVQDFILLMIMEKWGIWYLTTKSIMIWLRIYRISWNLSCIYVQSIIINSFLFVIYMVNRFISLILYAYVIISEFNETYHYLCVPAPNVTWIH